MAANISRRIGRRAASPGPPAAAESDTASIRSDETDLSDVSYQTTWSAPAGPAADQPDPTRRPYPNLAKYAKYFETTDKDKDAGSGSRSGPDFRKFLS